MVLVKSELLVLYQQFVVGKKSKFLMNITFFQTVNQESFKCIFSWVGKLFVCPQFNPKIIHFKIFYKKEGLNGRLARVNKLLKRPKSGCFRLIRLKDFTFFRPSSNTKQTKNIKYG